MKKKKGSRVTPKGTQDPNAARRRIEMRHGTPAILDEFERQYGHRPKALPGSGYCMSCGKQLVPPPAGPDKDHAVCHACFPEDLRDQWEGRQVEFARVDLEEGTVEEVTMPPDPFDGA